MSDFNDFSEKEAEPNFVLVNPAEGEKSGGGPKIAPQSRKKKFSSGAAVLAVLAVLAAFLLAASVFGGASKEDDVRKNSIRPLRQKNALLLPSGAAEYIAELDIEGKIETKNDFYDQNGLLEAIEKLSDDSRNKGIMLKIDSPGGTVYESDEAYLALMAYKEKTGRPIWAHFESLGASGAYYIACCADKIFANRNSLVGSIGVIAGSAVDATALMEKCGVKVTTFASGRNKNMLDYNSPVTEEQREIMQSIADDAYEQFVQIVADSRAMPLAAVRNIADGRIYTARQAERLKIIDGIGSFDDFCGEMKEFCGGGLEMEKIEFVDEPDFWDKITRISPSALAKIFAANAVIPRFAEDIVESRVVEPSYIFRQ